MALVNGTPRAPRHPVGRPSKGNRPDEPTLVVCKDGECHIIGTAQVAIATAIATCKGWNNKTPAKGLTATGNPLPDPQ